MEHAEWDSSCVVDETQRYILVWMMFRTLLHNETACMLCYLMRSWWNSSLNQYWNLCWTLDNTEITLPFRNSLGSLVGSWFRSKLGPQVFFSVSLLFQDPDWDLPDFGCYWWDIVEDPDLQLKVI